jgi:DNA excision repair protein ERCC-2
LARVTVGFSGTLTPLDFYGFETGFDAIERQKNARVKTEAQSSHYPLRLLSLASPFDANNQMTLVTNFINYSYQHRHNADENIAQMIADISELRPGKYLVFVPSFDALENVKTHLGKHNFYSTLLTQSRGESESERTQFINTFTSETSVVALAVLGGVYSEALSFDGGVDGVFVISTGIPAPSREQNHLKQYYEQHQYNGFEFACLYPGFTKIQQAVGRLIRSEKDRGFVVLVDSRFNQARYRNLMPDHWNPISCENVEDLKSKIVGFWQ